MKKWNVQTHGKMHIWHIELAAGEASNHVLIPVDRPAEGSVAVDPQAAGIVLIEFTLSPPDHINAGTAIWHPWPSGQISASTDAAKRYDSLDSAVTALRARNSGAGNASAQILA